LDGVITKHEKIPHRNEKFPQTDSTMLMN